MTCEAAWATVCGENPFRRCSETPARLAQLFFAMLMAIVGCQEPTSTVSNESTELKALGLLYGKYVTANAGRMPENEEQLMVFIQQREADFLDQFGVTDPNKLFVSPRNGSPFLVLYGRGQLAESNPMVAYEKEPVNGKRLAVWMTGSVYELDEAEFQKRQPST